MGAAEDVTRVLSRRGRYLIEQRIRLRRFLRDRGARLRDGERGVAKLPRGAQARFGIVEVEPHVHARLVVSRSDQALELLPRLRFHVGGKAVLAPGFAYHGGGAAAVASGEQSLRET